MIDPEETPPPNPDVADSAPAAEAAPAPDEPAPSPAPDRQAAGDAAASAPDPAQLAPRIEALLLATDRPLPASKINELLAKPGVKAVSSAIKQLNQVYQDTGRAFRIEEVAGGFQMMTLSAYKDVLAALRKSRADTRLSPAALETLAIIAYKQPILRAEIEAIRGVACGEVLRSLMERRLVKIVGRAEELGRPMLYGTTKTFLEVFGLADLTDLPKVEDLKAKPA